MRQKITQIGFSIFAVVAIFFATPAHAAILFQDDNFATIDSDGIIIDNGGSSAADVIIQFGTTLGKTLKWSAANSRFEINSGLDLGNNQISTMRIENLAAFPGGAGGLGSAGRGRIVELTAIDNIAPGCTSPSCPTGTYTWNGSIWKPLQGSVTTSTATKIVTVGPTGRDYTTIAAAAAYLNTLSAGEMWIDPGTFSVTTTVNLENITLVGADTNETTISISGAGLLQVKDTSFERLSLDNSTQTGTYGLDVKYSASSISSLQFIYTNFIVGTGKFMIDSSAGTKPTTITTLQNCTQSLAGGTILNTMALSNLRSATPAPSTFTIINLLGNALRMSDWPVIIIGGSNVVTSGTITTIPDRTIYVSPGMNIQAAINSLGSNGGVVKLLIGMHDITNELLINQNNIEIVGEGPGTVLHASAGTWAGGTTVDNAVIQVGLANGTSPRTNVNVRNFKIQVGPNIHGVSINGGTEDKVMDMIVQSIGVKSGTRTGIVFTDSTTTAASKMTATRNIINSDIAANRWVDGLHFDGNADLTNQLFGYGNGIIDSIISETIVSEAQETSYAFSNVSASSVFSNRARNIGFSATAFGMFFNDATDVMVINNSMEGANAAATGISLYDNVDNSVFIGNAVRGGPTAYSTGINVAGATSSNNIISNNQFNTVTTQINDAGTDTKLETMHHRATVNPVATNDINSGYTVGTIWVNTSTQAAFLCVNSAVGAAVWQSLAGGHIQNTDTGTTSNTFTMDTDNTGGNVSLQFGQTLAETLTWDSANSRFVLSDDLNIADGLTVNGNTIVMDNDNTGGNVSLQFGQTANETLTWDATNTRFNLSDDLNVADGLVVGGSAMIGTGTAATKLDVNGDIALRRADVTAVNGNNNNYNIGAFSFAKITGPTAGFNITGIAGGQNGRIVILYNATGQNMTFVNESTNSTAANRITTLGGTVATAGTGSAVLIYDAGAQRWLLVNLRP